MRVDKVLEVLNEALEKKDIDLWLKDEKIKRLEEEIVALNTEIERTRGKN